MLSKMRAKLHDIKAIKTSKNKVLAPWLTLGEILSSLVAALAFAMGHHAFYQNLSGQAASNNAYQVGAVKVTAQQLNIAVGTALAFLVKASLDNALSTAYVQLLWRAVKRTAQDPTLADLDTIFSALSSALSLLKFSSWRHFPLLLLFAWLTWYSTLTSSA